MITFFQQRDRPRISRSATRAVSGRAKTKPQRSRRGLSLVEVSVSTLLTGLIVVGALRCLATSTHAGTSTTNRTLAMLLAEDLMEEILQHAYAEPDNTVLFGVEGSESVTERSEWDDVDDYHGWQSSPPRDHQGVPVADLHWTRSVVVEYVRASHPSVVVSNAGDTGVKRVTVVVYHDGLELARLTSVQTKAWISMIPDFAEATTTGQLPPTNSPPTAFIGGHINYGTGIVTVTFSAAGSSDPENQPLEYNWDFGDQTSASGQQVTHTFQNTGSVLVAYTVRLTVQDIYGGKDSKTSLVTIYPNP